MERQPMTQITEPIPGAAGPRPEPADQLTPEPGALNGAEKAPAPSPEPVVSLADGAERAGAKLAEIITEAAGNPPDPDAGLAATAGVVIEAVAPSITEPEGEAPKADPAQVDPGGASDITADEENAQGAAEILSEITQAIENEPEPLFRYSINAKANLAKAEAAGKISAADRGFLEAEIERAEGKEILLMTNIAVVVARSELAAAKPKSPEARAATEKLNLALKDQKVAYKAFLKEAKKAGENSSPKKTEQEILNEWSKAANEETAKAKADLDKAIADGNPDAVQLALRHQALEENRKIIDSKKKKGTLKSILTIIAVATLGTTIGNVWKQARGGVEQPKPSH